MILAKTIYIIDSHTAGMPTRIIVGGVQKVIHPRFFQGILNQKCLAGLAGSKKEMRLLIKERGQIQNPLNISDISALNSCCRFHRHISCQMTINLSIKK